MTAEGDLPLRTRMRTWAPRPYAPLELLFRVSIAFCVAATLVVMLPGVHGHWVLPTGDLLLDTVALLVAGLLTARAWARYEERGVVSSVYHASAFLALTTAYSIAVIVSLLHGTSMSRLAEPEDVQILVFDVARLAAAILFVIAGAFTARRSYGWAPLVVLVTPALAVVAAGIVGQWLAPPPDALQIITFDEVTQLPHITPFGAVLHLTTAGLFFAGAYVSRSLWRSGGGVLDGWIAVGLVFAGFAELQWTLYPSAHPGQVSTGDLLRMACSVTLLLGLEAAARADLRELQVANVQLAELRDADVERAALEERARLARELHDGLAQDLWLAKLRTGELAGMEGLPPEATRAAREAMSAIDTGLGDAREAVAALRSPAHVDTGFCTLVRRTVEDYGDRFGLRVEYAFEGEHATHVAPRTQAEVLRITQEALTNVARHAQATVVGVRLAIHDERIRLRVVDNGRGFDTSAAHPGSYGLLSMRERAELIGGRLRVTSRVGIGTAVVLAAPLGRQAALASAGTA